MLLINFEDVSRFSGTKRQQNLLRLYIHQKNAKYINKLSRLATCLQYLSEFVIEINFLDDKIGHQNLQLIKSVDYLNKNQ